ncbi:zinc transporter 6-like [Saccostrea echinata]|uniref:zinc transporter 6-like n=1 Tax=Saccostrea echinata TaxID=191078 RepID=UPI002A7F28F7|nr:zinc transporter 6-like [Saccostrea echinata]
MTTHNSMSSIPDLISSSVSLDLGKDTYHEHQHDHTGPMGTIYPFGPQRSFIRSITREFRSVLRLKQSRKIILFLGLNVLGTVILFLWCHATNSMALTAYTYLTIYDIFSLLICLLSLWVQMQKPSPAYSFGYERFEVLAVFASTMLAQLGALFIIKESIERLLIPPEIHTGRLMIGTVFAFFLHMFVTYSINNKAINHTVHASSSSWLQEHVSDMSESVCHVIPGLSKILLPRINPFALIGCTGAIALILTYILVDTKSYYSADTWAAMAIAIKTCGTMFPMSVYTGKILLQTAPSHILGQLDKVLREASTLDGVLEFRHEHFWTLSFGTLAGSVQVRVRRDADEQMVLAHVYNRLSNLVSQLTVQIFKDDWTRASSYNLLAGSSFPSPFPPTTGSQRGLSPNLDQSQRYKVIKPFSQDVSNVSQDQRTSTPIRGSSVYGPSSPNSSYQVYSNQGHGHSHQGHGHSHQGHGHSH